MSALWHDHERIVAERHLQAILTAVGDRRRVKESSSALKSKAGVATAAVWAEAQIIWWQLVAVDSTEVAGLEFEHELAVRKGRGRRDELSRRMLGLWEIIVGPDTGHVAVDIYVEVLLIALVGITLAKGVERRRCNERVWSIFTVGDVDGHAA